MYIYSIQYSTAQNKTNPNFGKLIKDKSALRIIQKMSKDDVTELNKIEKRLSKSKSWDLEISDSGINDAFKFKFIHKKKQHGSIDDAIYPYNIQDNKLQIYSIIHGKEQGMDSVSIIETLVFKSAKIANKLFSKYHKYVEEGTKKHWFLTPIENLRNRELQLQMLEKGYHNQKSSFVNTEYKTKNTIGNL